ncbi:MAG: UDP-N-acetylmuramoyl-tripeptide--D-alanyl-D-alanine ligase [Polaromonas sp.]|nr:UDP-N-acetylmuramoyl-tripeptide--D-alanyl-D-alanine ligase [Polaromonas sp.]
MTSLEQIAAWLPSARLKGDGRIVPLRIHTDSRSLRPGDLFLALKGEHFDAHGFLAQARAQGAVAAIAQHGLAEAGLPGIEVDDTRLALGRIGAAWAAQFNLPLIAVTGSNGKTTVTQMIASILRAWKPDAAFATEGNLNNDIGVPLTLLRLRAAHQVGVVELGMNHPGEIAYLAGLVKPAVALINNAQREHLEFMATVDAVALENGSVLASLDASGTAVFPANDAYSDLWRRLSGACRVMTFALDGPADVTASARWNGNGWQVIAQTPSGPLEFALHIAGRHNIKNALAAVACALAVGVPLDSIATGLSEFLPVKGRSRALAIALPGRSVTLVDDTYNANPDSMLAALQVLAELPGPRLLVMGDMGEVGSQGPQFHREAGCEARLAGIEKLFTLGPESQHASTAFGEGRHFSSADELIAAVILELPHVASIVVKGSRFMKMERIVQAVVAAGNGLQEQHEQQKKKEPHAA